MLSMCFFTFEAAKQFAKHKDFSQKYFMTLIGTEENYILIFYKLFFSVLQCIKNDSQVDNQVDQLHILYIFFLKMYISCILALLDAVPVFWGEVSALFS